MAQDVALARRGSASGHAAPPPAAENEAVNDAERAADAAANAPWAWHNWHPRESFTRSGERHGAAALRQWRQTAPAAHGPGIRVDLPGVTRFRFHSCSCPMSVTPLVPTPALIAPLSPWMQAAAVAVGGRGGLGAALAAGRLAGRSRLADRAGHPGREPDRRAVHRLFPRRFRTHAVRGAAAAAGGGGLLGGLTTFSSFSGESLSLMIKGQWGVAVMHTLVHVCGALFAAVLGWQIGRWGAGVSGDGLSGQDRDAVEAALASTRVPELAASELSPDELRQALGRFVTGVTIVTCRDEHGEPVGLTANSFNALSLDPPLVLWSLRNASSTIDAFTRREPLRDQRAGGRPGRPVAPLRAAVERQVRRRRVDGRAGAARRCWPAASRCSNAGAAATTPPATTCCSSARSSASAARRIPRSSYHAGQYRTLNE